MTKTSALVASQTTTCARFERSMVVEKIAFDHVDAKGRTIGCIIERSAVEFEATDTRFGYHVEPGTFLAARVEPTRNGHRYGASQRTSYFSTAAEREAFVAKRVTDSRKAAAKKAAAL
jgi:hypothetical protein